MNRALKNLNIDSRGDLARGKTGNYLNKKQQQQIPRLAVKPVNIQRNEQNKENDVVNKKFSKIPIAVRNSKTQLTDKKISQENSNQHLKKVFTTVPKDIKPPQEEIENIDKEYSHLLLSDFAPEIYNYLFELERKQSLPKDFLSIKRSVTSSMRKILINWIFLAHQQFNLLAETLYITVSIIDRFLVRESIAKNQVQLLGATALLIASKFEEIYYPDIDDLVMICDNLYKKKDFLQMEIRILKTLKFELGRPLAIHFLRRGSQAAHSDSKTHMLGKYICELALMEYECAHWNPSIIAATALYLSLRLKKGNTVKTSFWTSSIAYYTGYSKEEVEKHVPVIVRMILNSENCKYENCRKKFAKSKYLEISKLSPESIKILKSYVN